MRDILFHGKRKDNGEWAEGSLLYDTERDEAYIAEYFEDKAAYIIAVDPDTVGQYTGMTEATFTPVYEGDIVRDKDGKKYIIYYDGFAGAYGARLIADHNDLFMLQDIDIYHTEVIGNIHDNPELLEVKYDDQP